MGKAAERQDNIILDAVGPEIFTFDRLVELIKTKLKSTSKIIHISPKAMLPLIQMTGQAYSVLLAYHCPRFRMEAKAPEGQEKPKAEAKEKEGK